MLNSYTLNIQESLKHASHRGIGFFEVLGSKNVKAMSTKLTPNMVSKLELSSICYVWKSLRTKLYTKCDAE